MNSRTNRLTQWQGQLTFRGIPSQRKHLYFYALLFLTTAVVHNVWRSTNPQPGTAGLDQQVRQMHEIEVTAKRLTR